VTDPIRDEIKWLGLALGDARDAKVVRDRLRGLLDEAPSDVVVGPVRRRLDATYAERARVAREIVDATLSSDRCLDLLAALDRLVADPPWTGQAAAPAGDVLPALVRKDWRRLRRRMAGVAAAEDPDRELHEVRKDAKRVRYGAEALEPVWGKDARRLADAAKSLTSHLGERQDIVMSRPDLLEIASAADAAGESSLTWGVLLAREEERAAELDHELADLWGRASRKRLRRWLGSSA
jgi:CHAD domain-containing protein